VGRDGDGPPLPPICHHEAPYGALSPDLGPPAQEGCGIGSRGGHGDAQRLEHICYGNALRTGAVEPGEETEVANNNATPSPTALSGCSRSASSHGHEG